VISWTISSYDSRPEQQLPVAEEKDLFVVQLFDAVLEHGAVGFVEDVGADSGCQ